MKNGRLQNDLSAEFIVAHAEFIIWTRLKTINSYASPPFVSKDQKGLKT